MASYTNPWAARFERLINPEEITRLAAVNPIPLKNIDSLPLEAACKSLANNLTKVFVPTKQCIALIQKWVGIAQAHCLTQYSDSKQFLEGVYAQEPPLRFFMPALCLTGLAGVGKTALVQALHRVIFQDTKIDVGSGHTPFPLTSMWVITVNAKTSSKDLLAALVGIDGTEKRLLEVCRRRAYRDGVALVVADEFQFATQSASANSRVTQMLLSLGFIGIPFLYVANFSLINRLMKRPQEDQQRLLADPLILHPDLPESDDWHNTVLGFNAVAPEIFAFDSNGIAAIHYYSAGLKRAAVSLLENSYRIARETKKITKVTTREIELAYHSQKYSLYRNEVEILTRQKIENRKIRNDLWCPIELPQSKQNIASEKMKTERSENLAADVLKGALTAEERNGLAALTKPQKQKKKSTDITSINRRNTMTSEEMKENENWIREHLK